MRRRKQWRSSTRPICWPARRASGRAPCSAASGTSMRAASTTSRARQQPSIWPAAWWRPLRIRHSMRLGIIYSGGMDRFVDGSRLRPKRGLIGPLTRAPTLFPPLALTVVVAVAVAVTAALPTAAAAGAGTPVSGQVCAYRGQDERAQELRSADQARRPHGRGLR